MTSRVTLFIFFFMLCNVSYGFQKKLSLKSKDSIIYQQKVWIVFKDAAEFSSYAFTLRSNAAKLILTNDSVHFVTKNKKLRKKHNCSIPYSKVISVEKLNYDGNIWGGAIPNRVMLITSDTVYQFGTAYKREKLIELITKQLIKN